VPCCYCSRQRCFPPDPVPLFDQLGLLGNGNYLIYPYTSRDNLTNQRYDATWRTLHVENEYLHCRVLPDLGGKLYGCLDKLSGAELFYTNTSVKKIIAAAALVDPAGSMRLVKQALEKVRTASAPEHEKGICCMQRESYCGQSAGARKRRSVLRRGVTGAPRIRGASTERLNWTRHCPNYRGEKSHSPQFEENFLFV